MTKTRVILKWTVTVVCMALLWAVQTVYADGLTLWGAAPDLLSVFVACAALTEGPRPGALLGILAGALWGASAEPGVFSAPLLFALGYLAGRIPETRMRPGFCTALLLSLPAALSMTAFRALLPRLWGGAARLSPALFAGAAVLTVPGAALLYPLCRLIRRIAPGKAAGL